MRVGSGLQVKRVAGQNMSFLNGLIGSRASRVKQVFFFFLEINVICQLFMISLTVIRFSLVILLSITTKYLIPKFDATLVPAF